MLAVKMGSQSVVTPLSILSLKADNELDSFALWQFCTAIVLHCDSLHCTAVAMVVTPLSILSLKLDNELDSFVQRQFALY